MTATPTPAVDWREQTCRTCGHTGKDHEANECWVKVDGKQCGCTWLELTAIPAVPSEPPLTDEALASLEARAAAATAGPWTADHERLAVCTDDIRTLAYVLLDGPDSRTHHPRASAVLDFIAAARTDVPRLVASLRSAREELMSARAERVELIAERDQARADLSEDWHSASRCGERPCPGCIIEDLVEQKAAAEGTLAGAEQATTDARRLLTALATAVGQYHDTETRSTERENELRRALGEAEYDAWEYLRPADPNVDPLPSRWSSTIRGGHRPEALAADVPAAPVTTGDCASGCTEHATCRADVPAAADDHEHPGGYLSTACLHELHEPECGAAQRARGDHSHPHCKYCGAKCVCGCHTGGQVERAERVHVDGCTLAADDPHHAGWCKLPDGEPDRWEYGFYDDDRVMVFDGTPRAITPKMLRRPLAATGPWQPVPNAGVPAAGEAEVTPC